MFFQEIDDEWQGFVTLRPFRLEEELAVRATLGGMFLGPTKVVRIVYDDFEFVGGGIPFGAWRLGFLWGKADPVPRSGEWVGTGGLQVYALPSTFQGGREGIHIPHKGLSASDDDGLVVRTQMGHHGIQGG